MPENVIVSSFGRDLKHFLCVFCSDCGCVTIDAIQQPYDMASYTIFFHVIASAWCMQNKNSRHKSLIVWRAQLLTVMHTFEV